MTKQALYQALSAGQVEEAVVLAAVTAGIPQIVAEQLRYGLAQVAGPEPDVVFAFDAPASVVRVKILRDGTAVESHSVASAGEVAEARRAAELRAQASDPNYKTWLRLVAQDRWVVENHPVTAWLRGPEGMAWRRADESDTDAAYYRTDVSDALRLATWLAEYVVEV